MKVMVDVVKRRKCQDGRGLGGRRCGVGGERRMKCIRTEGMCFLLRFDAGRMKLSSNEGIRSVGNKNGSSKRQALGNWREWEW
jgi:hypothetical protein